MIGFVCVMHKSKLRLNGFKLIDDFINSLYKFCKKDFILYLFDNGSDEKYKVPNYLNIMYEHIKDQTLEGLARPYNEGIKKAVKDGCDIIVIANDDLIFNETINKFFGIIENHKHNKIGLYGPLTNGINKNKSFQEANIPGKGIRQITKVKGSFGVLNGFMFAFTKEFYQKFKMFNGEMFDPTRLWGGGERALRRRIIPIGARMFIIKDCWLKHIKLHTWPMFRRIENESKNKTKNTIRK